LALNYTGFGIMPVNIVGKLQQRAASTLLAAASVGRFPELSEFQNMKLFRWG